MQPLSVCMLVLALLLISSEASGKPHSLLQNAPRGQGASRELEPQWQEGLGRASHHHVQQGSPHLVAELAKKQAPWQEEEEEAYGWMDFGRRSAENSDPQP
ncbi:gastrin [Suncus etruscus]|uniref:gastrin n=1 Tax=Suncus etruscus TaxID=109475 RepID=UPI00210F2981|nr:gastrin [Suncus etruscus]